MSSNVNSKKLFLAVAAVFVVHEVLGYVIHAVLMTPYYQETYSLWRMPEEVNMGLVYLVGLVWSLLFTYIFTKGYEGKGLMEGIRYGLLVGLLISVPGAFGTYAVQPITLALAIGWFIYGTAQAVACGLAAALVYQRA